ncbi:response regulator transcription factor [Paenibacillus montanisoli]|uniref:DNA-binding response regulator n=1 Tax=Paenibacillus montanisoli TaxID=2081970 RepID=A0A328TWY5_9BACL|nr:response regulator [Paenibacillus montanisoli]RAP73591.1 hypothetical protein DL346_25280 [Paenibacillus montanisoli]
MYRILIVDDERIEREGIRQLIRRHRFPLEPVLAENGEAALAIVQEQQIDLIITDIKMPFMDGLEFSERVSSLKPDIPMIIYSAYSDFEFARRALKTNVNHYLLKPIQIPEFMTVMKQVIEACDRKREDRIKNEQLLEGYNRGLAYEREKVLMDALYGVVHQEHDADAAWLHLMLIDCGSRFFDNHHAPFTALMSGFIPYDHDYVNLNEHQSAILVKSSRMLGKEELLPLADGIVRGMDDSFAAAGAGIVVGRPVNRLDRLSDVFNEMEAAIDYKFFAEGNPVLFTGEETQEQPALDEQEVESMLKRIYGYVEGHDAHGALYGVDLLFSALRSKGKLSVIYTKFICSELVKRVYAKTDKGRADIEDISVYVDQIFRAGSLTELKALIGSIIERLLPAKDESGKDDSASKLITGIKKLIEKGYSQDLSLEAIAEQVHLTPSYLSYLFKKETGRSLVRYITHVRMEKAVELLTRTNMKIIDISESLGYSNSSYFIQIFRNHHGVSPAKYRESAS